MPVINYGHLHYGENKVQEAVEKWTEIKKKNNNLKLHLIGRLQTNKVKFAVKLFDYIHSLDSKKLADKICKIQKELKLKRKFFIQVNIGNENQKSGVLVDGVIEFYKYCKNIDLVNSEILKNSTQTIVGELKMLKDLYKSGDLTKEEFTKAKKKVLESE